MTTKKTTSEVLVWVVSSTRLMLFYYILIFININKRKISTAKSMAAIILKVSIYIVYLCLRFINEQFEAKFLNFHFKE